MPLAGRCVHRRQVRIALRTTSPRAHALSVTAGGRTRTIHAARLRMPLVVVLHARRTRVDVTVRLANRLVAKRTVRYVRCS